MSESVTPIFDPNGQTRALTKTTTFTGASGLGLHGTGTTVGTIAGGQVEVVRISGRVTTTFGGTGTLSLGVTGSLALFIATTTTANLTTALPIWTGATGLAGGIAYPALTKDVLIAANVIIQSNDGANDVTSGVLEINILWRPVTPGATLV